MSASEVNGDVGVIVFPADNGWAHAYTSQNEALLDDMIENKASLAFFDARGHALIPVTGADGRVNVLKHADTTPDPEQVRDRLHLVLGRVPEIMLRNQDRFEQYVADGQLAVDRRAVQLPSLKDADLVQTMQLYRTILGPHSMDDDLQNRGSTWHNIIAHGW